MTIDLQNKSRKCGLRNVLSASESNALDAASEHAAMSIRGIIITLAETDAHAEQIFKQMSYLRTVRVDQAQSST